MSSKNACVRNYKAVSTIALIIITVIVVGCVAIAYLMLKSGSTMTISAATTLNVTGSAVTFRLGNGTYAIALASIAPTHDYANVYLDRLPSFANPLLNITLYLNQETKVNAGTASADIALKLGSIGNGVATLTITPISAGLGLTPDSQYIRTVNTALKNIQQVTTANVASSVTVTTVQSTSTTTVNNTNTTKAKLLSTLRKSAYYALMLNYSTIYANTLSCTPALYNTTYLRVKGMAPSGMSTYANESEFVPYALYSNISYAGYGVYAVMYF